MIQEVRHVHWFRFVLLEDLGTEMSNEWEATLATDSKSLFNCLNKLVCTFTQTTREQRSTSRS